LGILVSLAVLWPMQANAQTTATAEAKDKIDLRILYAGHAGSQRETEFAEFLKQYFRNVQTMDLAKFTGKEPGFDVAIIDYDGDYFQTSQVKPPQVMLQQDYGRPTVTVGVLGAMTCGNMSLKTGYM
jgi:hypothetical protein